MLDDTNHKLAALEEVFERNRRYSFSHSLTDAVIREILKNINVNIHYLVTYNTRDFYDVCAKRDIGILDE